MRTQTALLALAASAGLASAQFTVLIPAATSSDGASITATYGGASTIFSSMTFSGDLTEINTATFASEADWDIFNNTGGGSVLGYDPTTTTGFTGTISVSRTSDVLVWADNGDEFQFDSFESFDDGGDSIADAQWDNASFEFSGAVGATALGNFSSSLTISTDGSGADTEIAVYTLDGTLVDTNDDNGGGGLWSLLNLSLADGDYLLVLGGFNSEFGDGFALSGTAAGTTTLTMNGAGVATSDLAGNDFQVFSFTVPAPGSAALLGLGGLAAIRRRR